MTGIKIEHIEAESTFKFTGAKKANVKDNDYMYFRLIKPVSFETVQKILGVDPNKKGISKEESDEIHAKIYDAMEIVDVVSRSLYIDPEYNQMVDTPERPHKKWDCTYFRDRLAPSEADAIRNLVMSVNHTGGVAPMVRPFFPISKARYEKEMQSVLKLRKKRADAVAEYCEGMVKMNPGLEHEPDADKIDRMTVAQAHRSKGNDEFGMQDPDTPTSVFSNAEQAEAVRKVKSQLKARNRASR